MHIRRANHFHLGGDTICSSPSAGVCDREPGGDSCGQVGLLRRGVGGGRPLCSGRTTDPYLGVGMGDQAVLVAEADDSVPRRSRR